MSEGLLSLARSEKQASAGPASVHSAHFDDRTKIWSVGGGYLAAAMFQAAEDVAQLARPASLSMQFVRAVSPGDAEVRTETLRQTSVSELLESRLTQGGRLASLAHIWTAGPTEGPDLRPARMPLVPQPDELHETPESGDNARPRHPSLQIFEERRIARTSPSAARHRPARALRWIRYRDPADGTTPFRRAASMIPIIDLLGVPAATSGHGANILTSLAPTIQLSAHFYELDEAAGWLLGDASAECVAGGLVNTRVRVWSHTGALVAQGLTQMLMRPGDGAFVRPASPQA